MGIVVKNLVCIALTASLAFSGCLNHAPRFNQDDSYPAIGRFVYPDPNNREHFASDFHDNDGPEVAQIVNEEGEILYQCWDEGYIRGGYLEPGSKPVMCIIDKQGNKALFKPKKEHGPLVYADEYTKIEIKKQ